MQLTTTFKHVTDNNTIRRDSNNKIMKDDVINDDFSKRECIYMKKLSTHLEYKTNKYMTYNTYKKYSKT